MSLPALAVVLASAAPADTVLLDFTATWCGPCQSMNAIISRLERQGYPIRKVDVDREPGIFKRYGVRSMPTFVLVVEGKEVGRIVGAATESRLQQLLAQIPKYTAQPRLSRAGERGGQTPLRTNDAEQPNAGKPQRGLTPSQPSEPAEEFAFPFPPPKVSEAELSAAPRRSGHTAPAKSDAPERDQPVIRAKLDQKPPAAATLEQNPLASSARIRVKSGRGTNYGSATIIDSRPGRTLLLTCGHVFRGVSPATEVTVDLFVGDQAEQYAGEVLHYELESDVGLLAINTSQPLPASPIAGTGEVVAAGMRVSSIGCGGGDPPSRHELRVTGISTKGDPQYTECTAAPEQGRSGGGLFNQRGEVIGVCFAADPDRDRGLYASLAAIHRLLDKAELTSLYRRESDLSPPEPPPAVFAEALPSESDVPPFAPDEVAAVAANDEAAVEPETEAHGPEAVGLRERRLEVAREALASPAQTEVVCIIRPLDAPNAGSRVIVINRASQKFVKYLTGELERQPHETSRRVVEPARGAPMARVASDVLHRYRRSQRSREVRPLAP
ncbi:MAG: trypsin-like peptidase domain-containing protein [Planctomycetes bacterium]|nr:trypsin-like peptidase domain-containing protein [Planctomycetota bacterium]